MVPRLLELSSATRIYNDGHPIQALRPTSLGIAVGDYVTITGASGSGKSTLLNVLGLLDVPDSGFYRVRGVEVQSIGERLRSSLRGQLFGFVFQAFHLLPGRSALENVEIGMLYGQHRHKRRRQEALSAVERVGLLQRAHADPRTLSGGERQRIAIARAVAGDPKVLFCYEPTGNLDNANSDNVLGLLRELNDLGLTVVVATHDHRVAAEGARRLTVNDGQVCEL